MCVTTIYFYQRKGFIVHAWDSRVLSHGKDALKSSEGFVQSAGPWARSTPRVLKARLSITAFKQALGQPNTPKNREPVFC